MIPAFNFQEWTIKRCIWPPPTVHSRESIAGTSYQKWSYTPFDSPFPLFFHRNELSRVVKCTLNIWKLFHSSLPLFKELFPLCSASSSWEFFKYHNEKIISKILLTLLLFFDVTTLRMVWKPMKLHKKKSSRMRWENKKE